MNIDADNVSTCTQKNSIEVVNVPAKVIISALNTFITHCKANEEYSAKDDEAKSEKDM